MVEEIFSDFKTKVTQTHDRLRVELSKLRTGRANASLLDAVRVEYYGTPTPLSGVASISVPEARLIVIKPWDKTVIPAIEKGIHDAHLGINPQNDGEVVRIPFPPLTEERRKEIVKQVKSKCEEFRVAIRGERRDANELLKQLHSEKEITDDVHQKALERSQKETDAAIVEIDKIQAAKEKDVLTV